MPVKKKTFDWTLELNDSNMIYLATTCCLYDVDVL